MEILKNFLKYVLVFIILIAVYLCTLLITSLIPQRVLKNNVTKTSEVYNDEGEKKVVEFCGKEETLFIFTDALMVNTAYSINNQKPLESALLDRKDWVQGQTTDYEKDIQYNLGAFGKYKDANENVFQAAELYGLMHGENITTSYEYARYWHGYLVFLRPLLLLFSIKGIRILQLIILSVALIILYILCYKRTDFLTSICFLVSFLLVNAFVVTESLSEFTDIILSVLSCIYLLKKKDIDKHIGIDFMIFGSLSNFLTLLIYPMITLGVPLAMYFVIKFKEEKLSIKDIFVNFIKLAFSWCIGYGLTWFAKWALAKIICGRPIISEAIKQVKYRGITEVFTYKRTLMKNINSMGNSSFIIFGVMSILFLLIRIKKFDAKKNLVKCIPFLLIALFPFVWMYVIRQHSFIHSFFVNRNFILLFLGVMLAVCELSSINIKKTNNSRNFYKNFQKGTVPF